MNGSQLEGTRPWAWFGGRPGVDFVNTVRERATTWRELLESPADLAEWFVAAEISAHPLAVDHGLLRQAKELREAIDQGIRAVLAEERVPAESAQVINAWLARAADRPPYLDVRERIPVLRTATAPSDARDALCHIALDAAELMGTSARDTVRVCASAPCSALFVDRSAARRRRWCSMATCGNRAKAAQFRRSSTKPH
ncbi:CGNR zinc finger domain-containing protein [Streptomyces sclerotialus]|uniref:CGNR zinc finger domain-containing protein n=1 Tax=Streptomyces sclerotialus TaxID=1957 RepID=UPI0004C73B3C